MTSEKETESCELNSSCESRAMGLAAKGEIEHGEWNGADIPRDAAHADCFLGLVSGKPADENGRYKYPIITTGGKVSAKGVGSAGHYADANGETAIHAATEKISEAIKKHEGGGKSIAIIKLSKRTPYGDCIGPLGLPMASEQARAVESAMKQQPGDIRNHFHCMVIDAGGKKIALDGFMRLAVAGKDQQFTDGERADISTITTDSKDRDGEVVMPAGVDWSHFQKNPVVPFAHNYKMLPVGKSMWLQRGDNGIRGKTQYAARPNSHPADAEWFPDTVFEYIKAGMLPGKSIGFMPMGYRQVSPDEARARPDWKGSHVIDKSLLLEYSTCQVPANQDALCEAVSKAYLGGLKVKCLADALGMMLTKGPDAVTSEGDDGMAVGPNCPKCNVASEVQPVPGYQPPDPIDNDGNFRPLYHCMTCGAYFHAPGDLDDGDPDPGQGDQDGPQQNAIAAPLVVVTATVSPDAWLAALVRRMTPSDDRLAKIIARVTEDRTARVMGRP